MRITLDSNILVYAVQKGDPRHDPAVALLCRAVAADRGTAWRYGCQLILSEDGQDGRSLDGVTFVNPFNERNGSLLDQALPPRKADP